MGPDIDDEISHGRLGAPAFRQLALAEGNGNASPMKWLWERLRHVQTTIQAGRTVEVSMPGGALVLATLADFDDWCSNEFPDAFSYFFDDRGNP